jgi:hypothetical protein
MKLLPALAALLLSLPALPLLAQEPAPEMDATYENLQPVEGAKVAKAWADPNADFKRYTKFTILEPYVAFKKNWKREHRRATERDMERIKRGLADLFTEEFTAVLEEGGFPVVTGAGEDVLVIRPALIDLDVTAPDVMEPGRTTTYVANAGAVTLYIELLDSTTGAMLARAVDRKAAREETFLHMSSSVYNSAEARRLLKKWAALLRDRFKEIHSR